MQLKSDIFEQKYINHEKQSQLYHFKNLQIIQFKTVYVVNNCIIQ